MVRDLAELKIGDPVVHSEHGIGRYQGLVSIDMGNGEEEFLHLDYDKGSKLYVPVHQLHVISRYSGADPDTAPLHQLGSGQWDKAKRKAAQQIRDTAAELLNLYARRALRQGFAFPLAPNDYEAFAESFGFDETPDQAAAITAVIADMTSGKPMDRLVCGDVGFGKTEVALRAAFVAVMGGKQVAMLAPTTLLAEQHYQTLADRFADWPVRIAEISRFKNKKEIDAAIEAINAGTIDIVIGTHKLLSPDVKFNRLGLVIIDEEHRFGVRQKEALKTLRAEVDVLTLTATPIPRTLGMALEGLRDFSVIATAPQKRLAIKTFVRREEDGVLREAILRELKRGGQVYFLHNEVETIENKRAKLEELVPEARVAVAHGQMHERELERVMRDFVAQRANILLCTTIIETGIDVPTANTILIHRADKFGLAQLHQLRGRVGRSHHQAYAYLLVHDADGLTKQAQRRLEAIQQMEELGSGFYLAMHRPGDPRRGRGAGRQAVGRDLRNRVPALYRHAQPGGEVAQGRQGARPDGAAGGHHRDQPRHPRPAAQRLLRRRAGAPVAVQAPGQLRIGRDHRQHPGRADRPLRQAAAASAVADRDASASHRRGAAGHPQDRHRRRCRHAAVRAEPAGRCHQDHQPGAEEPPDQAGRPGPPAHREHPRRDRRAGAGHPPDHAAAGLTGPPALTRRTPP